MSLCAIVCYIEKGQNNLHVKLKKLKFKNSQEEGGKKQNIVIPPLHMEIFI